MYRKKVKNKFQFAWLNPVSPLSYRYMKHIDPIERLRIINAEIRDLTEMIRNTNNIYVIERCQLQINEYKKHLEECRKQNEFTASRNGLLIAK